jgi:VanZ family protein
LRKFLPVLPWIAAVAIVLALFGLGRLPGAGSLFSSPWDKLAHLFVYGALAVCIRLGARDRPAAWAVLITAAVGLLDELHQTTIPGRTAEVADFLADAAGALLGVAACMVFRGIRSRVRQYRAFGVGFAKPQSRL